LCKFREELEKDLIALETGKATINQIREKWGLPRINGGDEFLIFLKNSIENTAEPISRTSGEYWRAVACCFIGTVLGNLFCELLRSLFP